MKWSSKNPKPGWWFQRWKSQPKRWFIVEVIEGVILGTGSLPREIEKAKLNGAEWAGPIELPKGLK